MSEKHIPISGPWSSGGFFFKSALKVSSKQKTGNCFDCQYRKHSLLCKKYILQEDNQFYIKCYENLYSNTVREDCKAPIGSYCKDVPNSDFGSSLHKQCFKCAEYCCSLAEKPFAAKDEHILCTECDSNKYSSKYFTCMKTIMPAMKVNIPYAFLIACCICNPSFAIHAQALPSCSARQQAPIGTKPFIPKENDNYSVLCYENQFALHCSSCKKVVSV
ncbi:four and a half LIM domains protein 2-like [Narcine bancroftii]|uniref:four and a half LIM domains protein 2-like n=1 Tax=Narcine bancroftii TaxID=1343680 RepID=UPI003831FC34